jgi:DNA-binding HxlR family transcriptional regulator
MRSYGQFCSVAKALDVLGDRWTLLIVRELLLGGPSRYTDLRNGLPGIATNLLSERLRDLEGAGVLNRREAPPPVATTLYELTPRGEALRPVLHELGLWGIPYMAAGPAGGDVFRSTWLAWPAELFLTDTDPDGPTVVIELRVGEAPVALETRDGTVDLRRGGVEHADLVVSGEPHPILGLLSGELSLAEARRRGVSLDGDAAVLERVRPSRTQTPVS